LSLFNIFKEESEEDIPLDIACANVLIILTEYLSAYDMNDFREIEYLGKKIFLRNAFLSDKFEHLFDNDLLKNIHNKIPKNPESQVKILVNSLNSISEKSDSEFRFQLIFRISTIFNSSKNESDNFSSDQIHIINSLEKMHNNNLPFEEQIIVEYDLFKNKKNIMMGVLKKGDLINPTEQIEEILKNNEHYKKYI
tara:strand:+ start:39 stop:623 length:585 start_codon:yes stop_codon:yes gene_type:complete